jgi:hypothetical protein
MEDHAHDITEEKMIQHIVYNIKPKVYDTMVLALKRDLQYNTTTPLDLERGKDEIRQIVGQFQKDKTPETALTAGKFKKKFKGDCRICLQKVNKSTDCWDNDKNKSKRPTWYINPERKKASETANFTFSTAPTGFPADTANAATGRRPKTVCTYCKKEGHTEDRCFKKLRDNGITPNYPTSTATAAAVALLCYDKKVLQHTWCNQNHF